MTRFRAPRRHHKPWNVEERAGPDCARERRPPQRGKVQFNKR